MALLPNKFRVLDNTNHFIFDCAATVDSTCHFTGMIGLTDDGSETSAATKVSVNNKKRDTIVARKFDKNDKLMRCQQQSLLVFPR